MKKLKLVIVLGLSVVLFSTGFTTFASTGKTRVNAKPIKTTLMKQIYALKSSQSVHRSKKNISHNTNQPRLIRWGNAVNIFQNDPHNKWYISWNQNSHNNKVISGFYDGSGRGRGF